MTPLHIALAVGLTVIWGLNFVAMRIGLDEMPPLLFAALRFVIAGLPALLLPMPKMPVWRIVAIAMTLFVGQFGLFFPAMQAGYPPGLASLTLQVQAFFTAVIAMVVLHERPKLHNHVGMAIALLGLFAIGLTVNSGGVTPLGLTLTLAAGLSWASGNVILRGSPPVDMFALVSWLSVFSVPPLLVLSFILEGPMVDWHALVHMNGTGLLALLYVAIPTTVVGYYIWGSLLKRYPAAQVAPFTLLVPVTGATASFLILGETFSPIRLVGMALIMAGLVVNVFGGRLMRAWST